MQPFDGILLDIDNTIYCYKSAHDKAIEVAISSVSDLLQENSQTVLNSFNQARKQIHCELAETAASHNRLLYFQRMFEILDYPSIPNAYQTYSTYWDTFLNNMVPYDYVYEFLEQMKPRRICLLTDLTAHIQYRKVDRLNLDKYCECIVTSEEAGHEKPHPYMFMLALKKLNMQPNQVCMIGDSYKKDILGALNMGIHSFWLNVEKEKVTYDQDKIKEFRCYSELARYFE